MTRVQQGSIIPKNEISELTTSMEGMVKKFLELQSNQCEDIDKDLGGVSETYQEVITAFERVV